MFRGRGIGVVATLLGVWLATGCRTGSRVGTDGSVTSLQHVGLPADQEPPAAQRPRVQIGSESRYVLRGHPAVPLRVRDDQLMPAPDSDGQLHIGAAYPDHLAQAPAVRVDGWVSVRDPSTPAANLVAAREGRRVTLDAEPVIIKRADGTAPPPGVLLTVQVPPALRGTTGLATLVARRLPDTPRETTVTRDVDVPAGARLRFGFTVESPGWSTGWPPVRFRLYAEPDGAARVGPLFDRTLDPAADPRDRRWWDATVGLDAVAGRRVRFVFDVEAVAVDGAQSDRSFGVVTVPILHHPGKPAEGAARNVIVVSLDTLRAQEVGAYGHPRKLTPTLDERVAAAGALVRRAVTPSPYTPPAHMSMFSGLEPCTHHMFGVHTRLADEHVTLAERLRTAGWHTAAFTEDAYLIAANGFERGFDTYVENRSDESAAPGFAIETFEAARNWIAANDREPFFLFVHTYQVHDPYVPPRAYQAYHPETTSNPDNIPTLVVKDLDNYDREVRYTDDLFAGVLDAIDARGLADRTVLLVTSDHGEGFGEHFWTGHGRDVHDEAILVPMLVRAPGLVPAGRVVEELVGLIDVTPTLLDLVGLPPMENVQGRSFARLLGANGPTFTERPLLSFGFGDEAGLALARGIRTRTHKFLTFYSPPVSRFYDLVADPRERIELPWESDPIALDLKRQLDAATSACEADGKRRLLAERAVQLPDWFVNREQMDEALQKLKSLGYVQ